MVAVHTPGFTHPVNSIKMPEYEDIPRHFFHPRNAWQHLVSQLFFRGVYHREIEGFEFKVPEDPQKFLADYKAIREHLASRSYEHNHKIAGVAYLMSQHFELLSWPTGYQIDPPPPPPTEEERQAAFKRSMEEHLARTRDEPVEPYVPPSKQRPNKPLTPEREAMLAEKQRAREAAQVSIKKAKRK